MNDDRKPEGEGDEIPGLRGLKLEQTPERDLWSGIEARLSQKPRGVLRPWMSYAMAASLVGAVTLGVLRQTPPDAPLPAQTEVASVAQPSASTQRVAGRVMPQSQALLKANLSIVKDAEGQLQQALEQDPDSAALRRLLASMKNQRGDLKAQLARDSHAHAQKT
ncbi:MAG: hypothetical protein M3O62_07500 [Pseudomonadota bacterium]|nr:hypothetical protein [Pseudomonadota bacterium]